VVGSVLEGPTGLVVDDEVEKSKSLQWLVVVEVDSVLEGLTGLVVDDEVLKSKSLQWLVVVDSVLEGLTGLVVEDEVLKSKSLQWLVVDSVLEELSVEDGLGCEYVVVVLSVVELDGAGCE
jgi:hypothetical protein